MSDVIVNKVAESSIITINLEEYIANNPIKIFDLKDHLFMGLILKEKEFRTALTQIDWEEYKDSYVGVTCTADAIIPLWAYMLVASYMEPFTSNVFMGNKEQVEEQILIQKINEIDVIAFTDKRIVIKGCGDHPIPASAYLAVTVKLRSVAKSIMYGEPCSTVPIFKKK
jgi:hypothetical protein